MTKTYADALREQRRRAKLADAAKLEDAQRERRTPEGRAIAQRRRLEAISKGFGDRERLAELSRKIPAHMAAARYAGADARMEIR